MLTTVPDITAKRAQLGPERIAFRSLASGETTSYAQLEDNARKAAGLLVECGIEAGDRVAILCRNRVELFELLFACAKIGAMLVPLNWRMPARELQPLIDDAAPKVLFFGAEDAAVATALTAPDERRLIHLALDCRATATAADVEPGNAVNAANAISRSYRVLRDAAAPPAQQTLWPADSPWYLLYTSGTTGTPKAVIQTPGMAIVNYVNIRQGMGIGTDDVTLNYLPLFHTAGINLVTLPTLLEGGEVLIANGFELEQMVDLLADRTIDTFFGVPAIYQQLSLHPRFDSLDLSAVRSWGCGGAPMPDELISTYLTRNARVCNGMGMTETGPTVFLMNPAMVERKIGSVGKPQVLASVRIVDPTGRDVAPGQAGELWFGGPGITPGYWQRNDANAAAFSTDGWLRSGDIGRQDEDGYYYIVGRIKDMYISGGENVYPAEIENLLAGHPDILEAAIIAIPDDKWGEVGCAYLLLRPGHERPDDNALTRYCRERLAPYKVPKKFIEIEDFPRTAAGKIQKHRLGNSSM